MENNLAIIQRIYERKYLYFLLKSKYWSTMLIVFICSLVVSASPGNAESDAKLTISSKLSKPRLPTGTNPLVFAYDCLAALALYSSGKMPGELERAAADAEKLISMQTKDVNQRFGWSYLLDETEKTKKCGHPGALDAFGDGTCNPPGTPYMIQTGYAIACLAQLSIATGDAAYLTSARKAVADSWEMGTTLPGCKECFNYWYSYHPNDRNRYVRNTNLIMGYGLAWLYAATGDASYKERALSIARAEHREINAGNFGYFGIDDPRFRANPKVESQRIENHIPHQVKALKDISALLGSPSAVKDAETMLEAFLNCTNERCRPDNCKAWAVPIACKATATIAPCILADRNEAYRLRCDQVRRQLRKLNAFQTFMSFGPESADQLRVPASSSVGKIVDNSSLFQVI